MAPAVVDLFEVIDVKHDQRQRAVLHASLDEQAFHQLFEVSAVIDAGQVIGNVQQTQVLRAFINQRERCVISKYTIKVSSSVNPAPNTIIRLMDSA